MSTAASARCASSVSPGPTRSPARRNSRAKCTTLAASTSPPGSGRIIPATYHRTGRSLAAHVHAPRAHYDMDLPRGVALADRQDDLEADVAVGDPQRRQRLDRVEER